MISARSVWPFCSSAYLLSDQSECLSDREQFYRQRMWVLLLKKIISLVIESLSAEIENLKQNLYLVIETMRNHTGVGALPILPLQPNSSVATPVLTEQQPLTDTTQSLQALYDEVQRSYDSASAIANLLSTDHIPRSGKWGEGGRGWSLDHLSGKLHPIFAIDMIATMTYLAITQVTS